MDDLFKLFGGQTALARLLGCAQSTVAGWKQRGIIPARRQRQLFRAAKNLRLPVSADDLLKMKI